MFSKNTHYTHGMLMLDFYPRDGRFSAFQRINWKVPRLPVCFDSLALHGLKRFGSEADIEQTVSEYTEPSLKTMEGLDSNETAKSSSLNLPLSSAYEKAMEALTSLITSQKRGLKLPAGRKKYKKLVRMSMYLKILGLEEHLAGLKIIHVAGTKGKGSTCTFSEAILRESGFRTGLFISPHLIDVRERYRIDGLDISEEKFLLYFWDCWNQLKESVTEDLPMPPLFQFLSLLAFKIFVCEKVDVAIVEVGLGGKKDSTNVIKEPVVCGISSLGMDHMETLGDTLGKIASHKAGIFKPKIPAFTVPQLPEAMDVLQDRARELMVPLEVVAPLDLKKLNGVKLSLSGDHQYINAALAVALCQKWLQLTGSWEKLYENGSGEDILPKAFVRGLSTARLSGRAQIINDAAIRSYKSSEVIDISSGDLVFYLDGAHSPESMEACGRWFSDASKETENILLPSSSNGIRHLDKIIGNGCIQHTVGKESNKTSKKILLFNCMDARDPHILLSRLADTCSSSGTHFSKAIFVPNLSTYSKVISGDSVIPSDIPTRDLSWQFNLQRIWEKIVTGKDIVLDKRSTIMSAENMPPCGFVSEDVSLCNSENDYFRCSAVIPSLPLSINWLRGCVKENPSLRIQVLVTGSLHLVGDVLKLLRR